MEISRGVWIAIVVVAVVAAFVLIGWLKRR
jgi:hypothetical protein